MSPAESDRNLLFGVLALQLDFITRDALIDALGAWVVKKHKSLGEILEEHRALSSVDRALLEPLVRRHIEQHANDPVQSLASIPSFEWYQGALAPAAKADLDVRQSLDRVSRSVARSQPAEDPNATVPEDCPGSSPEGRFQVLRLHDRGGLGEVYVAKDVELDRDVALKKIRPQRALDPP